MTDPYADDTAEMAAEIGVEMPEAPETAMPDADTALDEVDEVDGTADPETPAHEDPDPETVAHTADADVEALAGQLGEGRLDGREDGRLLD